MRYKIENKADLPPRRSQVLGMFLRNLHTLLVHVGSLKRQMETKYVFCYDCVEGKQIILYRRHQNFILLIKHNRELEQLSKLHFSLESTGVLILK